MKDCPLDDFSLEQTDKKARLKRKSLESRIVVMSTSMETRHTFVQASRVFHLILSLIFALLLCFQEPSCFDIAKGFVFSVNLDCWINCQKSLYVLWIYGKETVLVTLDGTVSSASEKHVALYQVAFCNTRKMQKREGGRDQNYFNLFPAFFSFIRDYCVCRKQT